ncbi:DNA-directed RNA polymerase II subunit RPB2-like [Portunus trituberculatus]|uniref:DNA-directed RNA polymerase II subunit RPB2-like n=1 Tax=Portunus trituberculatus TaxID=210409 RepID=UPI001E1CBDCE|nr:DNA-directed RNA polymerase II subunit RPB2-like [Portunus trituberculatus]
MKRRKKSVVRVGIQDATTVLEVRQRVSAVVLKEQQLADVALEGYNAFLSELIDGEELFCHEFENECGRHVLRLNGVMPGNVQYTPLVCRQEERSYLLPLTVRASYICEDAPGSQVRAFSHRVFLGEIPLMVGSRLCITCGSTEEEAVLAGQQPGEPGGYFIVDGTEKFIPFRNLLKKNSLLVTKCLGQESQKFSFKCFVFSTVNGTEAFQTAVLASAKHGLVVKLSLGRGMHVLVSLSKVLAALGIQGPLKPWQETESFLYLGQTLAAIVPLREQRQQRRQKGARDSNKAKVPLTRDAFRCEDGSKSVVAEAVVDYLVAATQVPDVAAQDLLQVHRKCERSEQHHAALLRIATRFAEMRQEEAKQDLEYTRRLTALLEVMLQGCEDVPSATHMVTAALTLPSQQEALRALRQTAKRVWRNTAMSEVLERVLVPHVGGSLLHRAFYLAFMTNQLLLVMCGRQPADDPLHLGNRMLVTPGSFVSSLFSSVMKPILTRARATIDHQYRKPRAVWPDELGSEDHYEDDHRIFGENRACLLKKDEKILSEKFDILNIFQFHHNIVGEKMCKAFRTGTWGEGRGAMTGVTQNLERLNYMQYLSQVRTVNGEDKVMNGQGAVPHQLHTSIVGFLCLMETPENEHVGLAEHLALGAALCRPVEPTHVQQALQMLPVKLFTAEEICTPDHLGKVFVDGRWVGNAEAPLCLIKARLVEYRRRHTIHLGVHLRNHDLHIDTSGGRPVRPLLVVQGGSLALTCDDLVALRECRLLLNDLWKKGVVDFLDPLENSAVFIAETAADLCRPGVDYCQLQAVLSHGIVSAATPVGSTNPGVRRLGSCKMQKQAMGQPVVSELLAHRGTYSMLKTPEAPLAVPAFILNLPNARLMYSGQSALTAVMAVRGLNQEDGLVFSKGAIDRGLFTSLHFRYYRKHESLFGAEVAACAEVGWRLKAGDVVIMCKDERYHVRVGDTEGPSEVSRCCVRHLPDGRVLYEVETVQERRPEVGDKFATLNGQKGVICAILPDCQLPKLEDGRTPDIFISPHSFLDRQTVGFFLEGILNILAVHTGVLIDATSIDSGWDLPRAQDALRTQGLSSAVKVLSATGREMGRIFCAPIFYMRLKHLAVLKCHARHDGPVDPVFRQPAVGLAHGGGLRLGEMEVSALVSHGAADLVQEFMHDQSDGLQLPYCNACLRWAEVAGESVACRQCRKTDNLVLRRTTYSFKVFEECLLMVNLKLLQYGQGHDHTESDGQYHDSEVASLSSDDEAEWRPERRQDAVEAAVKESWRGTL